MDTSPHPYTHYTNGQSGTGSYPHNVQALLEDALNEFVKHDSLTRFDQDADGFVDGIFLIHAGGGAEAEPDPVLRRDMIWSHKWVLPTPFVNGGVKVFAYSTEPEDGRVGVFSHEFGHVLGLPDLYDTSYRSAGVGEWCLMGGGSWGGGGNTPTRLSAWCLDNLQWITPQVVTCAGPVRLDRIETHAGECLKLWTRGNPANEYFLVEWRDRAGRDSAMPGDGVLIWHIDETMKDNSNPRAYRVGLIQADGKFDLQMNANSGDDADPFPGSLGITTIDDSTHPSLRSKLNVPTGVSLRNIAIGSAATFDVTV